MKVVAYECKLCGAVYDIKNILAIVRYHETFELKDSVESIKNVKDHICYNCVDGIGAYIAGRDKKTDKELKTKEHSDSDV